MKREADQFEYALQRSAQGEPVERRLAPLVQTARQVGGLSETPPSPPHGLILGRQRFLAEAARLRGERVQRQPRLAGAMRLATALGVVAILIGVVLGAGRAAAASLPGQPLYGVKLATETIRLAFTSAPASRSALDRAMAEERLDEILALLERKQAIGAAVSSRAVRQLEQALVSAAELQDPAASPALQRLAEAIRQREQAMLGSAGGSPEPPVRQLLREMERVRQEAHAGEGDPDRLRQRLRYGSPAEPTDQPGATPTPRPSRTPGQPLTSTPRCTGQPSSLPDPRGTPDQTPGSSVTPQPPRGPFASPTPGPSATRESPEPPHASRTTGPSGTPAPTGGPSRTPGPGQTPGSGGGNKP